MKDQVIKFMKQQKLQIDRKRADDYRLLHPGVYSHKCWPWSGREGITDGVVCHLLTFDGECKEVHLGNLDVRLDSQPQVINAKRANAQRKGKPKKETKPKSESRAARIARMINDLD